MEHPKIFFMNDEFQRRRKRNKEQWNIIIWLFGAEKTISRECQIFSECIRQTHLQKAKFLIKRPSLASKKMASSSLCKSDVKDIFLRKLSGENRFSVLLLNLQFKRKA